MNIVHYKHTHNGHTGYGVLEDNQIRPLLSSIFSPPWQLADDDETVALDQVKLLAPVRPGKLIAIGLNYKQHAEEMGKPLPAEPMMFLVSPTAVIDPDEPILLHYPQHRIEHEGELAVIIGRRAEHVSEAEALDYVLGYTCCNDVSDRVLQKRDGQFTRAKSFTSYKPLGPLIATQLSPQQTVIRVTVNGEVRQQSGTADMIFPVAQLIAFVSAVMPLEPGDVILTGTPSGVSALQHGDTVDVSIAGIGSLSNPVEDAAQGQGGDQQ